MITITQIRYRGYYIENKDTNPKVFTWRNKEYASEAEAIEGIESHVKYYEQLQLIKLAA